MSRWGGELTRAEAHELASSGIQLAIVGTGNPAGAGLWAKQQADMAHAEGLLVDAYIYLYFKGDPAEQVRQALATLAGATVRMWWLDAEDMESPDLTTEERGAFLDACVAELEKASVPFGVYTGRWWWEPNMASSTKYSHLPLWNSWYDGDPDEDGLPYGGWTHSAIEQYEGTTTLCGQSVDLNYAKNLEDEMLTQDQFNKMFETAMGTYLPTYLKDVFEDVPGRFSDRPDLPISFPYKPWGEPPVVAMVDDAAVKAALKAVLQNALTALG